MRAVLFPCCLLLASVASAMPAQIRVSPVRIRVLTGRTLKPLARVRTSTTVLPVQPYALPIERLTDRQGTLTLLIENGTEVSTSVMRAPACRARPKADRNKPQPAFPVDQIVAAGLVAGNSCSKRTVAPTPGELTLFVRQQHWWQRLRY